MNALNTILIHSAWAVLPVWLTGTLLAQAAIESVLQKTSSSSGGWLQLLNAPTHSIAVLPINGVILPQENGLSALLGATTLDRFTQAFEQALKNPAISEIILTIDSPGGVVTGVHECAEMMYQARGKKPMTAYVSSMGASAAYWLASACDEIVIDATASVGSIGVLSIHTDDTQRKAQQGLSQIHIVSSQSPRKRLAITTEEGKAEIQAQVDAIAEVFVANVARNRKVSMETVLNNFGQGSLLVGEHAVKHGLADRLGSLQQLIQEKTQTMQIKKLSYQPAREKTMTDMLTDTAVPKITADYLIQHHADLVQAFRLTSAQEERERIQAVEDQLMPGHEALIQQLKFDGKTTGAEAAIQVLAAEKARQSDTLSQLQAYSLHPLPIARSVMEEKIADSQPKKRLSLEEESQINWQNDSNLHAEFDGFETYLAFVKAEHNGQIHSVK